MQDVHLIWGLLNKVFPVTRTYFGNSVDLMIMLHVFKMTSTSRMEISICPFMQAIHNIFLCKEIFCYTLEVCNSAICCLLPKNYIIIIIAC